MSNNTIIEVRPGNGGADAEDFASSLAESLSKALVRQGHTASTEHFSDRHRGFEIKTNAPLPLIEWFQGVHVVQRIPKGSAARHTSSASVLVRQGLKEAKVEINKDDLRIDRYRGHGKGGQKRNKVSTAIRLVHLPTGTIITRESGRSQSDNLESAMEQLKSVLQEGYQKDTLDRLANTRSSLNKPSNRAFTHNEQRSEVVHNPSGKRFSMKDWNAGKIS